MQKAEAELQVLRDENAVRGASPAEALPARLSGPRGGFLRAHLTGAVCRHSALEAGAAATAATRRRRPASRVSSAPTLPPSASPPAVREP